MERFEKWGIALLAASALAALIACGDAASDSSDATSVRDAAMSVDGAITPDAASGSPSPPTATFNTSGGGSVASASFRSKVSIGAPQPMGRASSSTRKILIGPNLKTN